METVATKPGDAMHREEIFKRGHLCRERMYSNNGRKTFECFWKNERKEGLERHWYDDGQKYSVCTYKHGEKEGVERCWYEDGQEDFVCTWKNGRREGLEKIWYFGGTKFIEWKNGIIV